MSRRTSRRQKEGNEMDATSVERKGGMLVRQKRKQQQCRRRRHATSSHRQDGTPGEGAESTDAMVLLFVVVPFNA
jgi:hypothetical protein